ncbi:MAG: ABC transporter substrate-binding protein [Enhydrobacter sp.]|nr:MAG: ABC transporter substrate-binding protein [Enhydrobacter sp.]
MTRLGFTRLLAVFLVAFSPGATMAQAPDKVEILLDWKPLPTFAGFFLARQLGAFERRGLDVTFKEVQGALMSAEAIGKGDPFWIGSSSGMATAMGRARGLPIKSLAVYYRETPSAIFSRAEDRIAHPRDLYGKTLGVVPGSITNDEVRAMFAINRLDLGQVKRVEVKWDPFDLLEKKVDALVDYEEMTPAELLSEGRRLLVLRLSDFGVRTYSLNLIVNEEAFKDPRKREIALKIVDAVQEGYSIVKDRPSDASLHFSRMFPRLAPNYVVRGMVTVAQQLGHPPIGVQTRDGWDKTLKLLGSLDLLAKPITVEEIANFE